MLGWYFCHHELLHQYLRQALQAVLALVLCLACLRKALKPEKDKVIVKELFLSFHPVVQKTILLLPTFVFFL